MPRGATRGASEYEQHQRRQAIESEVEELKHAMNALGYMEERAANKLQADVDEVDHLVVRRHLLTDRAAEAAADAEAVEGRVSALRLATSGGSAKAEAAESAELHEAAASLRGSGRDEVTALNSTIAADTADGRRMDAEVRRLSRARAAVARQVKQLSREGDHLQELADTAGDYEAFEKAGYFDASDPDDPYVMEAKRALEQASGWQGDKLEAQAADAREAMTAGLSEDPGQAVMALKALR